MSGAAPPAWRARLARLPLHPFEIVTYGAAIGTLLFLRSGGLAYGWNTVRHTVDALVFSLPVMLVLGVAFRALACRFAGEPVREYLRTVATPRWLALWTRVVLAFVGYVYAYMWLKVSVPMLRAELFDAELWRLDRWLHLGVSPTVLAIELVAGTPVARWVDEYYAAWLYAMPLWSAYVYASTRNDLRRNYALAASVLWIAGAWIYYTVPAIGPCYWSPDVMEPIREAMPKAVGTQWRLWEHYKGILESRGGRLEFFSPVLGVAAMPSLHVGAYVFFALWSKRYARRWYRWWVFASLLIFGGSLATGWHYAVDGYVGALLAWGAVRLADRIEPVAPETPAEKGEAAAVPAEAPS